LDQALRARRATVVRALFANHAVVIVTDRGEASGSSPSNDGGSGAVDSPVLLEAAAATRHGLPFGNGLTTTEFVGTR